MSRIYQRSGTPYWWWTARHNGTRYRRSTKVTKRDLARKVQQQWDLKLALGDLSFLGLSTPFSTHISDYFQRYQNFLSERKTENTVAIARGVLNRLRQYLDGQGITRLEDIRVQILDGYIGWLKCSPKTKKNHVGVISRMLDQAVKQELIAANPAKKVTLPKIVPKVRHRPLDSTDLEIIFKGAGSWYLYYLFLYRTGLRAGDVALLTYGNIDRKKKAIVSFIRKSRRIHEFPIAQVLLDQIPEDKPDDEPLFPESYINSERKLNDNLSKPRKYMQELLRLNGRPKATLHSFRVTFNNTLRDMGLSIEDRQVLLAHASSSTTKIYTHPNFDLATDYVNRMPDYS